MEEEIEEELLAIRLVAPNQLGKVVVAVAVVAVLRSGGGGGGGSGGWRMEDTSFLAARQERDITVNWTSLQACTSSQVTPVRRPRPGLASTPAA